MRLEKIDLNLLVIFRAIAREKHVTKAAQSLKLSQPTVSQALNKLRKVFDDQLFIKSRNGVVPTQKTQELISSVETALSTIENEILLKKSFDMAKVHRKFQLASLPFLDVSFVPALYQQIEDKAQNSEIITHSLPGKFPKEELILGKFDIVISSYFDNTNQSFLNKKVFEETYTCVVGNNNNLYGDSISFEDYVAANHIMVPTATDKKEVVDFALEGIGKHRNIKANVSSYLAAIRLLSTSDAILTVPTSLAENLKKILPLRTLELPMNIPPQPFYMYWHERHEKDPEHAWLRNSLQKVFTDVFSAETKI